VADLPIAPSTPPRQATRRSSPAQRPPPMASVAGLCCRGGWTRGLIDRLLGEPDKFARNPHYASTARAVIRDYVPWPAVSLDMPASSRSAPSTRRLLLFLERIFPGERRHSQRFISRS
jgi:hypothetical protein